MEKKGKKGKNVANKNVEDKLQTSEEIKNKSNVYRYEKFSSLVSNLPLRQKQREEI